MSLIVITTSVLVWMEDALAIASRMEAYAASVIPCQHDGDGGDRKRKQKFNSVYAIEGKEQQTQDSTNVKAPARAEIERQLADLQVRCNENRVIGSS